MHPNHASVHLEEREFPRDPARTVSLDIEPNEGLLWGLTHDVSKGCLSFVGRSDLVSNGYLKRELYVVKRVCPSIASSTMLVWA